MHTDATDGATDAGRRAPHLTCGVTDATDATVLFDLLHTHPCTHARTHAWGCNESIRCTVASVALAVVEDMDDGGRTAGGPAAGSRVCAHMWEDGVVMEFVECPEEGCVQIALVTERYVLESTDGPVEHARVACVSGHRLNCPTSMLKESR